MITVVIHYSKEISPRAVLDTVGKGRHIYKIGPDFAVECRDREDADLMANRFNFIPGMSATLLEDHRGK